MKKILFSFFSFFIFHFSFFIFFASSAFAQCQVTGQLTLEDGSPTGGIFIARPGGDCDASGIASCVAPMNTGRCTITIPPGTYCFDGWVGAQRATSVQEAPCGGTVSLTVNVSPPPPGPPTPTPPPSPLEEAIILGMVYDRSSQYSSCPDGRYYFGDNCGNTGCHGTPNYTVTWSQGGNSETISNNNCWSGNPRLTFEWTNNPLGDPNGEYVTLSISIQGNVLLREWSLWTSDSSGRTLAGSEQSGTFANPGSNQVVTIRVYRQGDYKWNHFRFGVSPTPPPPPHANYCAIQQLEPPLTSSPIIHYTLYDSYTFQESGFNECKDITRTWYFGGNVVLADPNASEMSFSRLGVDYLEGYFQDQDHYQANLFSLSSSDFNQYHGRPVKLAPHLLLDIKRVAYVRDVLNTRPALIEASHQYTDVEGKGPALTISELVARFGFPNPPRAGASEAEIQAWNSTWGHYWAKIPLSTNDQSLGKINYPYANEALGKSPTCQQEILTVPDNYRFDRISGFLNELLLPKKAQFLASNPSSEKPIASTTINSSSKLVSACPLDSLATNGRSTTQKDFSAQSTSSVTPRKATSQQAFSSPQVLAETSTTCGAEKVNGRQGPGNDICFNEFTGTTFVKEITTTQNICFGCTDCPDEPINIPDCDCAETKTIKFDRSEEISFQTLLPYLENIWNKTTYSEEGKPGIFDFFTPTIKKNVLLSQPKYRDFAATSVFFKFVDTTNSGGYAPGDPSGTLTPQQKEELFPRFMSGEDYAKDFVIESLWPF